jgi:hypothetical protein
MNVTYPKINVYKKKEDIFFGGVSAISLLLRIHRTAA